MGMQVQNSRDSVIPTLENVYMVFHFVGENVTIFIFSYDPQFNSRKCFLLFFSQLVIITSYSICDNDVFAQSDA